MSASTEGALRCSGFTLMEVLVTLVLLSTIASVAMPYAEMTVRRTKEVELRRALRETRSAIDEFHRDWRQDLVPAMNKVASRDGYPVDLSVLVEGIRLNSGTVKKYLRRIPVDPFADGAVPAREQWRLIGYRDAVDAAEWNRKDVYDLRSRSEQQAIDKSFYNAW